MPLKLFKHKKSLIFAWACTEMGGPCWEPAASCWMDELSRPFKDEKEKTQWIEDSVMIDGRRIGPIINKGD